MTEKITAALAVALRDNEDVSAALAQSDAGFRALVSQALVGVVMIEDGKFIYSNAYFNEMFGYSADEMLRLGPVDLAAERDRSAVRSLISRAESGETRVDLVVLANRKSGGSIHIEIRGSLMEVNGRKVLVCLVMDVTQRIRAEHEVLALQEQLRTQATQDPLTGLYNRRFLEDSLTRELVLAQRAGHPVSLIFGDLDHFKGVNDRYGHLAGDEVLRAFGALMKHSARASDIGCRYGGEEFVLVMPQLPLEGAMVRAERLRSAMAASPVPFEGFLISVTASFGVASFPQDGRNGNALIAAADSAMYSAKMAGRNRVHATSSIATAGSLQTPVLSGLDTAQDVAGGDSSVPTEIMPVIRGTRAETGTLPAHSAGERRLLAMTENVTDLVVVADANGRITYVSPSVRAVGGFAPQDVLGHAMLEFVEVAGREEFAQSFKRVVSEPGAINRAERWYRHKDGRLLMFDSVMHNLLQDPDVAGVVINLRDITQRHQTEHDLLLFRALIDQANDSILVADAESFSILDANMTACSDLGYTRKELLGMSISDIGPTARSLAPAVDRTLGEGNSGLVETLQRRKDGSTFPVEVNIKQVMLDRPYLLVVSRNITERYRTRQSLQESEIRFRSLIDATSDIVAIAAPDGTIKYVNEAVRRIGGYEPEDLIGRNYFDLLTAEDSSAARSVVTDLLTRPGETVRGERHIRHKDGGSRHLESMVRNLTGVAGIDGLVVSMRDVSEHRVAEQALSDSELTLRTVTGAMMDAVVMMDDQGKVAFWNESAEHILGYSGNEAMGRNIAEMLAVPRYRGRFTQQVESFLATGEGVMSGETRELLALRKDGVEVPVEMSVSGVHLNGRRFAVAVLHDITERNCQQHALARVNRALKSLSAGDSAVVHATSGAMAVQKMCDTLVNVGGYRLAWVGFAEPDAARTIRTVAWAGEESEFLHSPENSWAEAGRGWGPAGRCIRTGQAQVVRDIAADATLAWLHDEALQHGYRSGVALPLTGPASAVVGALMIFAGEADAFDADELALLSEMAGDLSYGLIALKTHAANEDNLGRLLRSIESTVRALGSLVELRDPYTAGHQRRVACVASEIGKLLGLDEDRLRGLKVAATIHDIGKILVPAEILSKPGPLSDAEFELIRVHPAAGADIVSGVEFPWPVAEMIRQHHERMDGSGYPRGLKGEEILLEARLIAVADVVEAMSSHRPYRPGKGIEIALQEVADGRGVKFDAAVVDACLKLFRDQGFHIPE